MINRKEANIKRYNVLRRLQYIKKVSSGCSLFITVKESTHTITFSVRHNDILFEHRAVTYEDGTYNIFQTYFKELETCIIEDLGEKYAVNNFKDFYEHFKRTYLHTEASKIIETIPFKVQDNFVFFSNGVTVNVDTNYVRSKSTLHKWVEDSYIVAGLAIISEHSKL